MSSNANVTATPSYLSQFQSVVNQVAANEYSQQILNPIKTGISAVASEVSDLASKINANIPEQAKNAYNEVYSYGEWATTGIANVSLASVYQTAAPYAQTAAPYVLPLVSVAGGAFGGYQATNAVTSVASSLRKCAVAKAAWGAVQLAGSVGVVYVSAWAANSDAVLLATVALTATASLVSIRNQIKAGSCCCKAALIAGPKAKSA